MEASTLSARGSDPGGDGDDREDRSRPHVGLFHAARATLRGAVLVVVLRALTGAVAAVIVGRIVDRLARGEPTDPLVITLAVALVVGALLAAAGPLLAAKTAGAVERNLRRRVLDAVLGLGPWSGRRTGDVVSKATEGIEAVGGLAATFLPNLVGGMLIPLLVCLVVATIDIPTAIVLALVLPLIPVLLRLLEGRFASVSARYRATADVLAARFLDGIQGLRTLKVLDRAEAYGDALAEESERLRAETMRLLRVNQLALLLVDTLFTLGTVVAAAGMASWRLASGAITTGEALAIILLGVMLIEPLSQIGRFFYVGAIGRAASRQVRELLGLAEEADSVSVAPVSNDIQPGAVRFDGVAYAYPDGGFSLSDVNFEVEPGQHVALVGPSGSGKTTIAHLMLGLIRPDHGEIHVGGRSVLVPQRPFLFHGTIAENLRLARPDASETEMREALEAAGLGDLMARQPGALGIVVGERGLTLSGGEVQRLAIARALLVDASVIVLDEPTSNVDLDTEARIQQALERLIAGRTVVTIAHRGSTIRGADRVVVVDRGQITSDGDASGYRGSASHGGGEQRT